VDNPVEAAREARGTANALDTEVDKNPNIAPRPANATSQEMRNHRLSQDR
jgi:hypothetical protein